MILSLQADPPPVIVYSTEHWSYAIDGKSMPQRLPLPPWALRPAAGPCCCLRFLPVLLLLLRYLYFRIAGEAYALVSIGLISFAAVAQFAPALLGVGYIVGLAGLMAVLFAAPYMAIDRREIFVLNALPLPAIGAISSAAWVSTQPWNSV